ncbi:hypothetical protein DDQ68_08940 [Hymenobacter nivis]|uniref:TonB-dependent receptor-like beta-barrel domain-containing protein n=1 Tax=Hymenobacter nivis TaxID=1850093 RepID=A0A2Z3GNJ4_9BACT|nr:hypothetical protein DDQ68_08940 [Hymenobacter nivis]
MGPVLGPHHRVQPLPEWIEGPRKQRVAGQPLSGANVFLKSTFDGASTDSLGRFRFSTGHAAGALPLVVRLIGFEPLELTVVLGRGPLRRGWSLNTGLALTHDDNDVRPGALAVRDVEQPAVARLVLTNDSASTWFNLKIGAEGLAQRYRQTYRPAAAAPGTPGAPSVLCTGFDEQRVAGFAESELVLNHRLAGRAGARAEYSALLRQWNAAPRLVLAYRLGPHGQLTAAAGYFYQTPANDLLSFTHNLGFERAQHVQLSYARSAAGRTLRGEVYQKSYAQLVTYDPANFYAAGAYRNGGQGYARGFDLFWRDRRSGPPPRLLGELRLPRHRALVPRRPRAHLRRPLRPRRGGQVLGAEAAHAVRGYRRLQQPPRLLRPQPTRLQPGPHPQLPGPEPERQLPHPPAGPVHHRERGRQQRAGSRQHLRLPLRRRPRR